MGGTLSNVFKGQHPTENVSSGSSVPLYGAPAPAGPSTGMQIAQGGIQGALQGLSKYGQPSGPTPGPSLPAPGPAPTPVDASFFQPTNFNMMGRNPNALLRRLVNGISTHQSRHPIRRSAAAD
jgi:hypothetical protein